MLEQSTLDAMEYAAKLQPNTPLATAMIHAIVTSPGMKFDMGRFQYRVHCLKCGKSGTEEVWELI